MQKTILRVLWLDGYEQSFKPKVGTEIRFEELYISLEREHDIVYIPMSNVRHFRWIEEQGHS